MGTVATESSELGAASVGHQEVQLPEGTLEALAGEHDDVMFHLGMPDAAHVAVDLIM